MPWLSHRKGGCEVHPININMRDSDSVGRTVIRTMSSASDDKETPTVSLDNSTRSSFDEDTPSLQSSSVSCSSNPAAPITGQLSNILDDYIVFPHIIGEGSFGCVRECLARRSSSSSLSSSRSYAVKSIEKSQVTRYDHLRRELSILQTINHTNIIQMIDCYEDIDYVHIITERYHGGDLFERINNCTSTSSMYDGGCFEEHVAAKIIKSLLEAVDYLHENDICHRDIKPENILFDNDGSSSNIKLIDFGFARHHTANDPPMTSRIGTSYFVSPDILKCQYNKSSCDVWAVGIIAYILLCGLPPFNGGTDEEIFEDITLGYLLFLPVAAWVDKSSDAKDFIECLLKKDIRQRVCSAKEALMHPWIVNLGGA